MSVMSLPTIEREICPSLLRRLSASIAATSPVEWVLGLAAVVVVGSWAIIAVAHLRDRFQVGVVSSICVTLARRLNDGVFYPDLFDGTHYGGTRYMPLSFVLHAGLARLTGEYLVSGKLITCGLACILCIEIFAILRGLGCGRGAAAALMSLVLLTPAGFLACTTIRGDLLAVVLQLAALLIVPKSATPRAVAGSAIFCTLAVLSKMTAVWAGLAIACSFLPAGKRRAGLVFVGTWVGSLAVLLLLCNAASSGRMAASFFALAAPAAHAHSLWRAPLIFLAQVANGGLALGLLVPASVIGSTLAMRHGHLTLYHSALFFCVPLLAGLCTDPGVDYNHLLDLVVLAVVVTGSLWVALPTGESGRSAFAVALGWILFAARLGMIEPRLREVGFGRGSGADQYPAVPLANVIASDEHLLADTPWIELSRGQTPTVLDCFAFSRLAHARPALAEPLLRQVRAGAFSKIILRRRLEDPATEGARVDDFIFGPAVLSAIAERYCLQTDAEGFFVYVPRG